MKQNSILAPLVMASFLVIVGCGGGGGGSAAGGDGSGPGGNTTGIFYETLAPKSDPSEFVTQCNAEGAKGYRNMCDFAFAGSEISSIYVKDSSKNSTFSYETLTPKTTASEFVVQSNAEGARGYQYMCDFTFTGGDSRSIYVKDNSKNSTFIYETMAPKSDPSEFVTQCNTQGANGYQYMANYMFAGSGISSVYVKDNSKNSTFNYETQIPKTTSSEFVVQSNTEGAKGYRYMYDNAFTGLEIRSIYVKDNSSTSTFSYETLTPKTISSEFVAQSNIEGTKGYQYRCDYMFAGTGISSLYVKTN